MASARPVKRHGWRISGETETKTKKPRLLEQSRLNRKDKMKPDELSSALFKRMGKIFPQVKPSLGAVFGEGETPFASWLSRQPIEAKDKVETVLHGVCEVFEAGDVPDPVPATVTAGRVDVRQLEPGKQKAPTKAVVVESAPCELAVAPSVVAVATEPEEEDKPVKAPAVESDLVKQLFAELTREKFKNNFRHEIQNGVQWEKTGVVKLIDQRVKACLAEALEAALAALKS